QDGPKRVAFQELSQLIDMTVAALQQLSAAAAQALAILADAVACTIDLLKRLALVAFHRTLQRAALGFQLLLLAHQPRHRAAQASRRQGVAAPLHELARRQREAFAADID